MKGVSLIKTKALNRLIAKVEQMADQVNNIAKERLELLDSLLTVKELGEYLKKGPTWIDAHKADIGFTKVGRRFGIEKRILTNICRGAITNGSTPIHQH